MLNCPRRIDQKHFFLINAVSVNLCNISYLPVKIGPAVPEFNRNKPTRQKNKIKINGAKYVIISNYTAKILVPATSLTSSHFGTDFCSIKKSKINLIFLHVLYSHYAEGKYWLQEITKVRLVTCVWSLHWPSWRGQRRFLNLDRSNYTGRSKALRTRPWNIHHETGALPYLWYTIT